MDGRSAANKRDYCALNNPVGGKDCQHMDSPDISLKTYVTSKALAKLEDVAVDCTVWKYKPNALAAMALFVNQKTWSAICINKGVGDKT